MVQLLLSQGQMEIVLLPERDRDLTYSMKERDMRKEEGSLADKSGQFHWTAVGTEKRLELGWRGLFLFQKKQNESQRR